MRMPNCPLCGYPMQEEFPPDPEEPLEEPHFWICTRLLHEGEVYVQTVAIPTTKHLPRSKWKKPPPYEGDPDIPVPHCPFCGAFMIARPVTQLEQQGTKVNPETGRPRMNIVKVPVRPSWECRDTRHEWEIWAELVPR